VALTHDGQFAFDTRNPLVRSWERWTPDNAVEVANAAGTVVRVAHAVETPVEGDVVCLPARAASHFTGHHGGQIHGGLLLR
jgi:hypothetical protein